ncbi:MAG: hypothetical protein ACREVI_10895 [Steroidobacteraceae bacterium]
MSGDELNGDRLPQVPQLAWSATDHWTMRACAKNLADERTYETMSTDTSAVTGVTDHQSAVAFQPRTCGVALDFMF